MLRESERKKSANIDHDIVARNFLKASHPIATMSCVATKLIDQSVEDIYITYYDILCSIIQVLVPVLPLDDGLWASGDSILLIVIGYIITDIAFVLTDES